ncbi:DNA-(apurinic or apyrimidinic site) lyase 2 [Pyricularia oryzae]|nr:DNA-(apurinic or apyrimidinic site) lyase 2 [Pyricularia oryzae]
MGIRITSWNVNGIRNPFSYEPWRENRTFKSMFDILEADIVVIQEAKIQRKDLQDDMVLVPGWDVYFSLPKFKKGYSGVAIYTRSSKCSPIRAEQGITGILCPPNSTTKFRELSPDQQIGGYPRPDQLSDIIDEATLDSEGRCMILEFPAFVLIGVYSPATRDETRTDFRQAFHKAMDARVRNLVAMGKQVVLTGDLNIIRNELDTAGILERLRKEEMTIDEFFSTPSRRFLNHMVFGGTVVGGRDEGREEPVMYDLGREFHPDRIGMYTCWETRKNARPGNFGSRIDYVLCSAGMKDWFIDANIQEGLLGSDHCPVYATLSDNVRTADGKSVPLVDIMNPKGMFVNGKRVRDWSAKDLLPLSAKLIPDFDRRRSIKDMFFKKPKPTSSRDVPSEIREETPSETAPPSPVTKSPNTKEDDQSAKQDGRPSSQTSTSSSTVILPQTNPSIQKRPSKSSASNSRPQKKTKVSTSNTAKNSVDKAPGQKSLTGFFKPKNPISTPATDGERTSIRTTPSPTKCSNASTPKIPGASTFTSKGDQEGASQGTETGAEPLNGGRSFNSGKEDDTGASLSESPKVFDPIENKESWSKLLKKRIVPKCEHDEPCISLQTKKPGINCGRSFYICGRPLGPSGEKEKGTEWRCGTFIWSSDWNASQQT